MGLASWIEGRDQAFDEWEDWEAYHRQNGRRYDNPPRR